MKHENTRSAPDIGTSENSDTYDDEEMRFGGEKQIVFIGTKIRVEIFLREQVFLA